MTIEGMWLMRSTQVDADDVPRSPGIIILESERLFGGDSTYYWVGNYSVTNGIVTGTVRTRTHTLYEGATNVFGSEGAVDYQVVFQVEFQGNDLVGAMCPADQPNVAQAVELTRLSDLP
jgi:hypothetical protein